MSKADYAKCSNFFVIVFVIIYIHFCASAPVKVIENAYTQFVSELNRNKCSVPSQVQLPFNATEVNNFEYLSSYLEICQKTASTKRNKEAIILCKEIFGNIRNISCPAMTALPDTISVNLSENVCQDIGALKDSVPEDDTSLLKRLTDGFLCDIMCDSEFEKACQLLLWSFKVQKQIASVASAQEPKQSILPVNGGNINVDSLKQENAVGGNSFSEVIADAENEKKNVEETKDVNEIVEHDETAVVSEPNKLEDGPDPNLDTSFIPIVKLKQEKLVSNDKGENEAVSKTKDQESTSLYTSANSTKTTSSVAQQKPGEQASSSNTELGPLGEMTKVESNDDQNAKKQLQSNGIKSDEVNAGGELPDGSNTNVAPDEETQDVNADGTVQNEKDTTIVSEHQDNSNPLTSQNIPVTVEDKIPGNEIPGETSGKEVQKSNVNSNDLPHESADEKSPNDAAADLNKIEQNPSDLVDTVDPKKLQGTTSDDDKTNRPITNSQTVKDATQQKTVQEVTQGKTSTTRDETKTDQPQTSLVKETQDHAKTEAVAHDPILDNESKNPSTDQKKAKIDQQTEFDNTIPDATEKPIFIDETSPDKSTKLKPSVVNPDGKSVIPSSPTETSTKTTAALENMEGGSDYPQPDDEETDHFEDPDNTDGDEFSEQEYDGAFVPKNKASNSDAAGVATAAKETVISPNEDRTNQNEPIEFLSRNGFGRDSLFPEQEDSHFFFYFLSIVLILMAGYLIFHNKQKIIALIVEGRHERNRRSHRIGYKKLETK